MPRKRSPSAAPFGERLAQLRKAAGYTQVQLAEHIGLSQRMISYYEKTDDHPIAKVLRHFARALEVSTDELLGVAPMSGKPRRRTRARRGD
jgi:transcriptional regulator with XRE-family HTH domain